jgi:hypothetical protein
LEAEKVGEKKEFMTSSGWFTNLTKHHSFHNMMISAEAVSAIHAAERCKEIIEEMVILQRR